MHLTCVLGTRPEAIKLAPVVISARRAGLPHGVADPAPLRALFRKDPEMPEVSA